MSRAFVKESDGGEADTLPERYVSPHRNLVTPVGLQKIDAVIRSLNAERAALRAAADTAALARIERDLRYWVPRRASAEVVDVPMAADRVRFGARVALQCDNGVLLTYHLVGEDEADPAAGLISWTSPLAVALLGQAVGDEADVAGQRAAIVSIG